jgi:hypothetical protein
VAGTDDPELATIVRALDRAIRRGGEVDVRIERGPRIRVRVEDTPSGTWIRATASRLTPDTARAVERLGWRAKERRIWREGEDDDARLVDDVSQSWQIVGEADLVDVAADVCDALEVMAGPLAVGPIVAHHVPLGAEDGTITGIGFAVATIPAIVALALSAVLRVAASYPLDILGSLVIPGLLGIAAWFIAGRIVLVLFARVRRLRPQAEPTALVAGAVAPAVAIVVYTAAAIRLGLP